MTIRLTSLVVAMAATGIAGCGGGGGSSSDSPAAPSTVNVASARHNLLRTAGHWVLHGTASNNIVVQMDLSSTPSSPGTFVLNGVTGNRLAQTGTISSVNGSATTNQTAYFDSADHVFGHDADGTECRLVTASATPLPTAAAVGASGDLETSNDYTTCTPPVPASPSTTSVSTWSITTDANITLYCENGTTRDLTGATTDTEQDCYEADSNGNIGTHARVSLSSGGVTLVARNY